MLNVVLKEDLKKAFEELGMKKGMTVMVHTSLKSLGYLIGGAQTVIEALMETITKEGNIMMPTQSWKNLDPSCGVHWLIDQKDYDLVRKYWPAYDKDITPTNTMGSVSEMFRKWEGVKRSDHPARSVAAWGHDSEYLTQNHTLENIFGPDSPIDRVYQLDGYVCLIGVDYDKNTSIHLADAIASYPKKHNAIEHSAILVNGKREWVSYETLFVDGEDFIEIGKAFEESHQVKKVQIGQSTLRFMRQRELVDFSIEWISKHRK